MQNVNLTLVVIHVRFHRLNHNHFHNEYIVPFYIPAFLWMLFSHKGSAKVILNLVYLVKNLIQRTNPIRCKYNLKKSIEKCNLNSKGNSLWYMSFFICRIVKKLDDKSKHMRCVIPTKDNPPPEMSNWLLQFQV